MNTMLGFEGACASFALALPQPVAIGIIASAETDGMISERLFVIFMADNGSVFWG